MKLKIIRAIDWIDDKIIRHHLYGKRGGLCSLIANSSWWGDYENPEGSEYDPYV